MVRRPLWLSTPQPWQDRRTRHFRRVAIAAWVVWSFFSGVAPAHSQELALGHDEIARALTGQLVVGAQDGRRTEQLFLAGGATFYTVDGAQTQGVWQLRGDQYCSRWPPGTIWACYDVLRDGQLLRFVSASGKSYPVLIQP